MDRFRRIRYQFGAAAVARTSILLLGLLGMAALGFIAFSSPWAAAVGGFGLAAGFLLRGPIARGAEYYSGAVPVGLSAYALALLAGDRIGLDPEAKLLLITATTVTLFDLQFWSLSDPSVVNTGPLGRR